MDSFLDSNVIIGYSLYLDPWHQYAENVFERENKSYWSKTVKKESENKIIEKMNIYNSFFIELISHIQKLNNKLGYSVISKEEFFDILLKILNNKISIQIKEKLENLFGEKVVGMMKLILKSC